MRSNSPSANVGTRTHNDTISPPSVTTTIKLTTNNAKLPSPSLPFSEDGTILAAICSKDRRQIQTTNL